ncbi:DUF2971 domain-containing protein [Tenacibaculum sp. nBUS_03]|uniref:DUF2971 domain-containing protein n=1 Tax=Tenacibaculum sp. nBUS_03 TaxID=3395320 RepID=UPI003EB7F356
MKKKINQGTLDDIEFPDVLYKYRSWKDTYNKRFITEREVFMASPNQFEDEIDCKIPVRYDLMTEHQAQKFYTRLSILAEPNLIRQQRRQKVREIVKQKDYLNSESNEKYQKKYFDEYFERLGVLSLTAENCLDKMWDKYADKHQGFCVGYNTRILFDYLGGGGKVEYVEEIPILLPDPIMDRDEIRWKQVYFKEQKWEFEKEYRTQKFWFDKANISDRQIHLPKEAFNCIILGKDISDSDRKEITESVRLYIGDIEIKDHKNIC